MFAVYTSEPAVERYFLPLMGLVGFATNASMTLYAASSITARIGSAGLPANHIVQLGMWCVLSISHNRHTPGGQYNGECLTRGIMN